MKCKYFIVFVFLIMSITFLSNFNSILFHEINNNLNFHQASLNKDLNKTAFNIFQNWFVPYVSLRSGPTISPRQNTLEDLALDKGYESVSDYLEWVFGDEISSDEREAELRNISETLNIDTSFLTYQNIRIILNDEDKLEMLPFRTFLYFNFIEVFGFGIGINIPVDIYPEGIFNNDISFIDFENSLQRTSLSINRSLMKEHKVDRLESEAMYLKSLQNYNDVLSNIFLQTIQKIINFYYYENLIFILENEKIILIEKMNNEIEQKNIDSLKKQLIQKEKDIDNLIFSKNNLNLIKYSDEIYNETLSILDSIIKNSNNLFELNLDNRYDIEALNLNVEKSNIQKSFWWLPYFPNININLNFSNFDFFNNDQEENSFFDNLNWSIGLNFEFLIYDRGQRRLAAKNRRNPLDDLILNETLDNYHNSYNSIIHNDMLFNYDMEIINLEIKTMQKEIEKNKLLYKNNFISRNDFNLINIQYERLLLEKEILTIRKKINLLNLLILNNEAIWSDYFDKKIN